MSFWWDFLKWLLFPRRMSRASGVYFTTYKNMSGGVNISPALGEGLVFLDMDFDFPRMITSGPLFISPPTFIIHRLPPPIPLIDMIVTTGPEYINSIRTVAVSSIRTIKGVIP